MFFKNQKKTIALAVIVLTLIIGISIGIFLSKTSPHTKCNNLFTKGEKYIIQKKFDEALYAFKALIKIYPNCEKTATADFNIGKIYEFGFKEFVLAKQTYKNLIKQFPYSKEAKYSQDKISLLENFKWYIDFINNYSNFKGTEYYKLEYKFVGQKEEFIKAIKFLLQGLPDDNEIKSWLWLYLALAERNNLPLLKKRLERIIANYKFNDATQYAYLEVASINFSEGRVNKSLELVSKLQESKNTPLKKHLNYALAEIYFKQNKFNLAVAEYKEIIDFYSPLNFISVPYFSKKDVLLKLSESLLALKNYKDATNLSLKLLQQIKTALTKIQNSESQQALLYRKNLTLLNLGNLYEKQNNLIAALKYYEQIYLFNDNNPINEETSAESLYRKSEILTLLRKNSLALSTLDKLINFYPDSYYLPWAILNKGKLSENFGNINSRYYLNIINKYSYSSVIIPAYYYYVRKLQLEKIGSSAPSFFYSQIETETAKNFGDLIIKKINYLIKEKHLQEYILSKADILFYKSNYEQAKINYKQALDNKIPARNLNFIYQTLSPKSKSLTQQIVLCDKENNYYEKIKYLLSNYNENSNPQYLYDIANIYLEKGDLNLAVSFLSRAALKSNTQAIQLLQNNLISTLEFIPQTINFILQEINTIENKFPPNSEEFQTVLQNFKKQITEKRILIVPAALNIYLSNPENMKQSSAEISRNLKFNFSNITYKGILNKRQFIFTYSNEQKQALNNLLDGLKILDSTLFQLEELVDIYFTSYMNPVTVWDSKKIILAKFYDNYLLPLENSFNLPEKFKITNGE